MICLKVQTDGQTDIKTQSRRRTKAYRPIQRMKAMVEESEETEIDVIGRWMDGRTDIQTDR